MKTARQIVNDKLSWSGDDCIKNHCVFVLEEYLKEEPTLSEKELSESLTIYLIGLE